MRKFPQTPQEYAREWLALIEDGWTPSDIVRASAPGKDWFTVNVRPLVKVTRCDFCGRIYNPNGELGTLFRCWRPDCRPPLPEAEAELLERALKYAAEWEDLIEDGWTPSEIVAASDPDKDWFHKHVRRHVSVTKCETCGLVFDPRSSGTSLFHCWRVTCKPARE